MKVIKNISELRQTVSAMRRSKEGEKVGLVPTMGYLHEGHVSLIEAARSQCGTVVLSIFVNPLQFGPNEDYETYPRDTERDLRIAEQAGVDIVFLPEAGEMYPQPTRTKVVVSGITDRLCGASRPGHFDGVATVVTKLFHIVEPDKAYFGMKDAQQVAVIEQFVFDLNMNVEIVRCPTLREADGLAMSSRNVRLSPEERKQAVVLYQALTRLDDWLKEDGMTFEKLQDGLRRYIADNAPLAAVNYAEVLTYPALTPVAGPVRDFHGEIIAALAVKFGGTRLIDNRIFTLKKRRCRLCSER